MMHGFDLQEDILYTRFIKHITSPTHRFGLWYHKRLFHLK